MPNDECAQPDASAAQRLLPSLLGPHGETVTPDNPCDLLVVFGARDPQLARDASALGRSGAVRRIVFSGGIGKDSGELAELSIPEGVFLAAIALADGLPATAILIEPEATNGGENAEKSLALAVSRGILSEGARVASLAPATRSRRLFEELRFKASSIAPKVRVVAGLASGCTAVDVSDRAVLGELLNEVRGLHSMHEGSPPRIAHLREFQEGGKYWPLVELAESVSGSGERGQGLPGGNHD